MHYPIMHKNIDSLRRKKMVLGQNFRFGFYDIPADERIKHIKRAGFDSVMFWWGDEFEETDGSRYDLIASAFKNGLKVNTLHFPSTHADWLWREEKSGVYIKQMIAAIEDCSKYGAENLVMHTTRALITPPYNEEGLLALSKAVKVAEREGVNIAVENTRFPDYNKYIYDNIPSDRLTLCYDTGHEHCYTKNFDVLGAFGDRITTTHIHDNDGTSDQHRIMGEGNIDFQKIFNRLKAAKVEYYNLESYCNETSVYYGKISLSEYLKLSYNRLVSLIENSNCKIHS